MMKFALISLCILLAVSCNSKTEPASEPTTVTETVAKDSTTANSFFPVTNYIRGQINDIRLKGVNPMIYTTVKDQTDSSWLKAENFENEMAPFLENTIDTTNLKDLFSEKKFLD